MDNLEFILLSLKSKWWDLIKSGKKKIEVRKEGLEGICLKEL